MTIPGLPVDVDKRRVKGQFLNLRGEALSGQVVFTPNLTYTIDAAAQQIISGVPIAADLDATGSFSIYLPCTDDTDLNPTIGSYMVQDPAGRAYNMLLPLSTPSTGLDLSTVVPAGQSSPGTVQLAVGPAGRGVTSMTINGSNHLVVTYSDGTTADLGAVSGGSGGSSDGSVRRAVTAAQALSGHRVVTLTGADTVDYADNATPSHARRPLWLTDGAAASGATVQVVCAGPVTEPSWSWTPGLPIYLGSAGALTQTVPTGAGKFAAVVGWAATPTTVFVHQQPSIVLAA